MSIIIIITPPPPPPGGRLTKPEESPSVDFQALHKLIDEAEDQGSNVQIIDA